MKNKVAYMGLFLALALVCSYVESLIPFYFGVPGVKLGVTNIVIILMLYCIGAKEAILVSVMRVLLAGFMFGNVFSIIYSLAGGLLSFAVMYLLKRTKKFKIISISVVGGVSHNIGQLLVAAFVVENYHIFYYGTVLIIAGCVTGMLIGVISTEIILRLNKKISF